ncbi:MAG: aminotransferase class I/II-fold pyridoxal phosphate-dependent enzyme [FCB group bacterium]|nr:aminotransferase class I/II-fold pyridoxal phosphate-dependent enzyme [FCB group bacterium]
MKQIDLRSDTVTRPSPEMRRAMAEAIVGDDVLGDDPTIKKLEAMTAEMLGKEAGLYVPSGTMSNQIALFTASNRGDEVLCETGCHILNYEAGAPAVLSNLILHTIDGKRGIISAEQIEQNIRPINVHCPLTKIVSLENTHNRAGGTIYPLETISAIEVVARRHGLWMHLDGARLWNAHVATGIGLDAYAAHFDTVSVCLSKGMGAPIGSVLLGTADFIEKARRARKIFGGGMRQVGIIAAAGIYALENNLPDLAQDHDNARYLGEHLSPIPGLTIDLETVQTNIVIVDNEKMTADDFYSRLADKGVLCIPIGPARVRFVTHRDVSYEECQKAVENVEQVMAN